VAAVWGEITAKEIHNAVGGIRIFGEHQTRLAGISTDSRNIRPGDVFFALTGERYDGHDFISECVKKGAAGVVVETGFWDKKIVRERKEFQDVVVIMVADTLQALGDFAGWWRKHHDAQVIAVTGSAGKTTTKEMTATILGLAHNTLKNEGNLNNLIGLPLTLLQLEKSHGKAVLEMGMNRSGEVARLTEIAAPDVGAITNVGRAHLEGVGNLEGVAKAKVELVEKMPSSGKVVLNGDDELLLKTASVFGRQATTFGLGLMNDVRADNIRNLGRKGVEFDLVYSGKASPARLRTPGLQNVSNALAAASVCMCTGEPVNNILDGLERFEGVKGRFMVSSLPGNTVLIDDTYNSNPSSLEAALESVSALAHKDMHIIVGLGEMMELGGSAERFHREAGRKVAELAPECFSAMGEHARDMIKGAVDAGMQKSKTRVAENHDEMIRIIRSEMREGCLIFLKGSRKMNLEKVVEGLKFTAAGIASQRK